MQGTWGAATKDPCQSQEEGGTHAQAAGSAVSSLAVAYSRLQRHKYLLLDSLYEFRQKINLLLQRDFCDTPPGCSVPHSRSHAVFTTLGVKIAIERCAGCGRSVRVGRNSAVFPPIHPDTPWLQTGGLSACGVNSRKPCLLLVLPHWQDWMCFTSTQDLCKYVE